MDRAQLRSVFGKVQPFRLEAFGLDLHIRRISASCRLKIGELYRSQNGDGVDPVTAIRIQCTVVAGGLVDEQGARLYGDSEIDAVAEDFDAQALDQLSARIMEISGLVGQAAAENLAKNSEPTPNADSPSA